MIGMFQSSRIASGRPRLQTSSAFSPSSASIIWKSRPSRIRLATFRMTLESSTTRHVFILTSASLELGSDVPRTLCRQHDRRDFENPIDIEYNHQSAVEPVNAGSNFCKSRIETASTN